MSESTRQCIVPDDRGRQQKQEELKKEDDMNGPRQQGRAEVNSKLTVQTNELPSEPRLQEPPRHFLGLRYFAQRQIRSMRLKPFSIVSN